MKRFASKPIRSAATLAIGISAALIGAALVSHRATGLPNHGGDLPLARTVLRVAHSQDGVTFEDAGQVFMERAGAADLEWIGAEKIIAVFDSASASGLGSTLSVSLSEDGGRSWSPRREVRIRGLRTDRVAIGHGDLVRVGDRVWQLFFAAQYSPRDPPDRATHLIHAAITHNGADYALDRDVRIRAGTDDGTHPMALVFGRRVHLFYEMGGAGEGRSEVRHLISRRGDRFASLRPMEVSDVRFVGSMVRLPRGIRAYVSDRDGIVSFLSADGRAWAREPGVRLTRGWDPAVTRLGDGSYLMVYSDALEPTAAPGPVLVDASLPDPQAWRDLIAWDDGTSDLPVEGVTAEKSEELDSLVESEEAAEEPADVDLGGDAAVLAEEDAQAVPEATDAGDHVVAGDTPADSVVGGAAETPDKGSDPPAGEPPLEAVTQVIEEPSEADVMLLEDFDAPLEDGSHWPDDWDPETSDGFAPTPNFETKVDYVEWLREFGAVQPEHNAFDAYATFMDEARGAPAWPEVNDMFSGDYEGPPIAWSEEDHPEWEASNRAMQDLVRQFRDATRISDYAMPIEFYDEDRSDATGDWDLLIGLRLPHLGRHRRLARATLANAWRVGEDGRVSPERMLDAWETALRGASHLNRGSTLIEDLVGLAERRQVQDSARWALRRGVFSNENLGAALDTLRRLDQPQPAIPRGLRGEHAAAMDLVQFMFAPKKRGEPLAPRRERIERVLNESWSEREPDPSAIVERVAAMTPADVQDTIHAFNTHYREVEAQMRIGYPDVRREDVEAATARYVHRSPVTEFLMPSLGRVYLLQARAEASRRATQLIYAVHVYKARNGRWPASLSGLPEEVAETVRIDPFSGEPFGYRVTDNGPVIYSVSENAVDDGGIHAPRWDDEPDEATGSDDYVFWPPQP